MGDVPREAEGEEVDRTLEARFTEVLENHLVDFGVSGFRIDMMVDALVQTMENYAYGLEPECVD